jgi:hypothetical protein
VVVRLRLPERRRMEDEDRDDRGGEAGENELAPRVLGQRRELLLR